jgi:hypothetical protein
MTAGKLLNNERATFFRKLFSQKMLQLGQVEFFAGANRNRNVLKFTHDSRNLRLIYLPQP